jgi:5'-3' exonuclease
MGITALGDFLKSTCSPGSIGLLPSEIRESIRSPGTSRVVQDVVPVVPLSAFRGHAVAIDALNIFHPLKVTSYGIYAERNEGGEIPSDRDICTIALGQLASRLERLAESGVRSIVVMDGRTTRLKGKTQERRRAVVDKYAQQQVEAEIRIASLKATYGGEKEEPADEDERKEQAEEMLVVNSEIAELNRRALTAIRGSTRVGDEDRRRIEALVRALGLPYVEAPEEAEKYCAQLVREGHARAAWSSDTDLIAHGCPVIIRSVQGETARVCILQNLLVQLDLDYEALVDFCVMCGSDYNPNVPGFGPKRCYDIIREYGRLSAMPDELVYIPPKKDGKPLTPQEEARRERAILARDERCVFRKALLCNKEEGKDWQVIRREFLERRGEVDPTLLELDESDLAAARAILCNPEALKRYSRAHDELLSAETRKVPFSEYTVA